MGVMFFCIFCQRPLDRKLNKQYNKLTEYNTKYCNSHCNHSAQTKVDNDISGVGRVISKTQKEKDLF